MVARQGVNGPAGGRNFEVIGHTGLFYLGNSTHPKGDIAGLSQGKSLGIGKLPVNDQGIERIGLEIVQQEAAGSHLPGKGIDLHAAPGHFHPAAVDDLHPPGEILVFHFPVEMETYLGLRKDIGHAVARIMVEQIQPVTGHRGETEGHIIFHGEVSNVSDTAGQENGIGGGDLQRLTGNEPGRAPLVFPYERPLHHRSNGKGFPEGSRIDFEIKAEYHRRGRRHPFSLPWPGCIIHHLHRIGTVLLQGTQMVGNCSRIHPDLLHHPADIFLRLKGKLVFPGLQVVKQKKTVVQLVHMVGLAPWLKGDRSPVHRQPLVTRTGYISVGGDLTVGILYRACNLPLVPGISPVIPTESPE